MIDVTLTLSLHSLVKLSEVYIVSTQHVMKDNEKSILLQAWDRILFSQLLRKIKVSHQLTIRVPILLAKLHGDENLK